MPHNATLVNLLMRSFVWNIVYHNTQFFFPLSYHNFQNILLEYVFFPLLFQEFILNKLEFGEPPIESSN